MRELNGTDRYEYITWFDEEGLVGINLTNHAEVKLLYQSLKRVVETEQVLAVVTRGSQFQPVFKKGPGAERTGGFNGISAEPE